jgi:hypothetical protein
MKSRRRNAIPDKEAPSVGASTEQARGDREVSYLVVMRNGAILAALALLIGVLPETIVASRTHVFLDGDVKTSVIARFRDVGEKLKQFDERKSGIEQTIWDLEKKLATAQASESAALATAHHELVAYLADLKPPVYVGGYYLNHTMFLWPAIDAALLWLIFLFDDGLPRKLLTPKWLLQTVAGAVGLHTVYNWTIWVRNFVAPQDGRRVFVCENADISLPCFLVQEFNTFVFSILLCTAWRSWVRRAQLIRTSVTFLSAPS